MGQEKANLASFFALMHVRTSSFRKLYAELQIYNMQNKMHADASNKEAFDSIIKVMEEREGEIFSTEEKEGIKDLFLRV